MITYIAIFGFCILGFLFPQKYHRLYLSILLFFLLIFVGLRHEVGADWGNYLILQDLIQNAGKPGIFFTEPGYGFLNYYFTGQDSIYIINAICSIFLCWGTYVLCRDQPYPLFSLSLLLPYTIFVVGMGYTRQATALGFIMMAYHAFANKKAFRCFLFVILALLFHRTAIIILLIYGFGFLSIRNYRSYLFLSPVIFTILYVLILSTNSYLDVYGSNEEFSSAGALYRHLMNVIPALIFILNHKFFYDKIPKYYSVLWFLSYGSIFFFLIGFQLSTFSDRFAQFFSIVQIIVYPVFVNKFTSRDRAIILTLIILFYLLFMVYWFTNSYWASRWWVNYKNYLFL